MSSATAVMDPARALDPSYPFRWIIAVTVTLASILEILDTSIVNVAIPHMMGTLGATLDQITWVSTGYIVANVIVLPVTGWMSAYFGRRRYFAGSIALFTLLLISLRTFQLCFVRRTSMGLSLPSVHSSLWRLQKSTQP